MYNEVCNKLVEATEHYIDNTDSMLKVSEIYGLNYELLKGFINQVGVRKNTLYDNYKDYVISSYNTGKYTQKQIAEECGISQNVVSLIVNGRI